jgi:hypothetical protein
VIHPGMKANSRWREICIAVTIVLAAAIGLAIFVRHHKPLVLGHSSTDCAQWGAWTPLALRDGGDPFEVMARHCEKWK